MRSVFLFLLIVVISSSAMAFSQDDICSDEISQLKILNDDLRHQLAEASSEISRLKIEKTVMPLSNDIFLELEKAKKDLKNQSSEVRMLREKMMISKDYALNGK